MQIIKDIELRNFEFWGGAIEHAKSFTDEQLNKLEYLIEEAWCDGNILESNINDLFWFETDWLANLLGFEDEEELINYNEL